MTITLHNLKSSKGSKKKKKRVGRGDGSGRGTYSGRGMKGQRSRTGGKKGLKIKGLRTFLRNVPKKGGFRSLETKMFVVNLEDLEKKFKDGDNITKKDLIKSGLIKSSKVGVKILGQGKLTKKLEVVADSFSKTAKDAIIKAGGKAEVKVKNSKPRPKKSKNKT